MSMEEYNSRLPFSPKQHPWLGIFHGDDKAKQTFFNLTVTEDRHNMRIILELRNKKIFASAHDWLMLLDYDSGDCYIWNPISNDKIQVPPLPDFRYNEIQCLLSAPSHDRDQCRLLFFDPPSSLYFCKPGYNRKFHKEDIQLVIGDEQSHLTVCTVFKGKFYGLTCPSSILVHLDLDHDLGIVTTTPMVNQCAYDGGEFSDMPRWVEYLIQSSCDDNDMLLCVNKVYYGWHVNQVYTFLVFRFDFGEKVWVKMKSIGETAIFLCDSGGTTCSTRGNNLKKGSIYFTEGRCLYVFDLETRKISQLSLPCPDVSKKKPQFCWFTLPHKCI